MYDWAVQHDGARHRGSRAERIRGGASRDPPANAALPNIVLAGACPAEGTALGRLVRRVDVIVCSSSSAERQLAGTAVQVMIDDRALDQRAVEMLAVLLVRQNGGVLQ